MTTRKSIKRASIGAALRKKFRTPREALQALGLDESLLDVPPRLAFDGANPMNPTRLEYLAVTRAARALNPLLAFDAKVEYGPIFKGLTTANFKARKPAIITGLKAALKGKTLAGDAEINMGHIAKMLDHMENAAGGDMKKSLDESVSKPQHNAMEAAAHGSSNLDIPKEVGKEFAEADRGKSFDAEPMKGFLREKGMSEDDIEHIMDMMPGEEDPPENALDESEEEKAEREKKEKEAADKKAADEAAAAEKDKDAKDMKAMDERLKGMVTQDAMKEAIKSAVAAERTNTQAAHEAREFVRPYVGELPLALDSAEKVLRNAATALGIKNAEKINIEGLRTIIELQPRAGAREPAFDAMAQDEADSGASDFTKRFPDAGRIGIV
jgi:hypothetical protein